MKLSTRAVAGLVVGVIAAWVTAGAVAADADLTGTWQLTVQSPAGTGSPTLNLNQDGNALSGSYRGQLGESAVQGSVDGHAFDLTFNVAGPAGSMDVRYRGELKDDDSIAGTIALGPLGQGTFTGKRQ
jgi:hypothetical protein